MLNWGRGHGVWNCHAHFPPKNFFLEETLILYLASYSSFTLPVDKIKNWLVTTRALWSTYPTCILWHLAHEQTWMLLWWPLPSREARACAVNSLAYQIGMLDLLHDLYPPCNCLGLKKNRWCFIYHYLRPFYPANWTRNSLKCWDLLILMLTD